VLEVTRIVFVATCYTRLGIGRPLWVTGDSVPLANEWALPPYDL